MNRENSVRSGRVSVQRVVCGRSGLLALEEAIESLFFVLALDQRETAHGNVSLGILRDGNIRTALVGWGSLRKHVKHELIVDLDEGDLDRDLIVETATNL